jgi:hypothetical protein
MIRQAGAVASLLDSDLVGPPAWDVLAACLRARKTLPPPALNVPRLIGVAGDPGLAPGT